MKLSKLILTEMVIRGRKCIVCAAAEEQKIMELRLEPSDKKNNAGSDPSIASSSTLKNSHQTGTDTKSTAKAKIKEEKPIDPYENLAVANVDDALNLREKPDTDAKVLGTCFRGGGGTILKRKNGWTKIRSGGLEGWLKDDYLVFGDDIKPLAKELGLYIATVST